MNGLKHFALLVSTAVMLCLLPLGVSAQDDSATLLIPDQPVVSELSSQQFAQVFVFVGLAGDAVTLTASGDVPLAMLVTDGQGNALARVADEAGTGETIASNVSLPAAGSYFVTVLAAPGNSAVGAFTITLSGVDASATIPTPVPADQPTETVTSLSVPPAGVTFEAPTQVLFASGIAVQLSWSDPVDLNLEVRDPFGNTLYWDSRTSPIGGQFGFDANGLCQIISENPVETATWSPGFLPTGSYEILVFYRQACQQATPASFVVDVTVEGSNIGQVQGTLQPPVPGQDSVYLANFIVAEDTTAVLNQGGLYPDSSINVLIAPTAEVISRAQPIALGSEVTGVVVEAQDYEVFSFTAEADQIVTVDMQATSGNLDTLLQLMDSSGRLVAVNDDANINTRNSLLDNIRLIAPGDYYIIATRYGKDIGGTEGEFVLTLSGASDTLPSELASLSLPQGDISFTLTWATSADMQLLVRDPLGDAVFDDTPQVNSGGILAFDGNVNCNPATTSVPVSHIYWPFGFGRAGIYEVEVWYQNNCGDTTPVEFTLSVFVDGQVVLVERQRPVANQRYVVAVTVNPDRTVQLGSGGFIGGGIANLDYADETPLPISVGQPVTGTLSPTNPFDVYAFQGTAGQVVTIRMQATSQTLDTHVFLVSPTGIQLADNEDADPLLLGGAQGGRTTDSLINAFVLPSDGQYLIIASRFATIFGGTIGGYVVTLE